MASLLDSKLKAMVAKAFKGKLSRGTFRRASVTAVDTAGDPTTTTNTDYTFEGIRESFSARYKAQANIPESDVSILILQGSLRPATVITLDDQDELIYLGTPWNRWHQIRAVMEIDPAGATARLQCFEIPDQA